METIDLARSQLLLHRYTEDAYLAYAMSTVKDRALAQVQDGNKPVQRRILYTMKQLGLAHDAKPVKSARIVGEVLGKLHPHGDSSVYDAMVRMAQPFTLRYPLVNGQGNFGSRDGDSAAAMRYTEARLAPIAQLLLDELGQGTVDTKPNYDGTLSEPTLLPAQLPMLLLNGTLGIAVGMASSIPPHNLREVGAAAAHCVLHPNATAAELLELLPGPDFPDGGQLISSAQEIAAAYTSGRGALRMRARWRREELARGQWQIVVYELPYQVSPKKVLEELDGICNPQVPKGKKTHTPQQLAMKAAALDLLDTARDESGRDEAIRLVLAPRTSKVDEKALMNFLLANTGLEENFSLNSTMVGLDGAPGTKTIAEHLHEWAQFRVVTVRRRTEWQLEQAEKRIHILEGRLTVFVNLDAVIKVIREAEDPKADLQCTFTMSELQADDILEMRLRQLNRLEGVKLEAELASLRKEADGYRTLLASEPKLRNLVVSEVQAAVKKFGDDRRTLIQPEVKASSTAATALPASDEPVTVVLSKNLWVRSRPGHNIDSSTLSYKAGDEGQFIVESRTSWQLILMDHTGRVYSVAVRDIPGGRGDGVPLSTLIEPQAGARFVAAFSGEGDSEWFFGSSSGYGYKAPLKSCISRPKAGKAFLELEEGARPLEIQPLSKAQWAACTSTDGRLLVFPIDEVLLRASGGKGVTLMSVEGPTGLHSVRVGEGASVTLSLLVKGVVEQVPLEGDEFVKYQLHRARKGYQLPRKALPA